MYQGYLKWICSCPSSIFIILNIQALFIQLSKKIITILVYGSAKLKPKLEYATFSSCSQYKDILCIKRSLDTKTPS